MAAGQDHRDDASPGEWQQEKFAANLYYEAASLAGEDENVVLSPWGVASLFAMLQTGARGYTSPTDIRLSAIKAVPMRKELGI